MLRAGACAALVLLGCAAAPALHRDWRPAPARGDVPERRPDQVPFAPKPDSQATARYAARSRTSDDAARDVALAYAEALLRGDEQVLSQLLDAQVTLLAEGSRKPRKEVIAICLAEPSSAAYAQSRRIDALFDPKGISVESAITEGLNVPLPAGAAATDRLVRFPVPAPTGTGVRRLPCLGNLYVRLGTPARIVALMR